MTTGFFSAHKNLNIEVFALGDGRLMIPISQHFGQNTQSFIGGWLPTAVFIMSTI